MTTFYLNEISAFYSMHTNKLHTFVLILISDNLDVNIINYPDCVNFGLARVDRQVGSP